MHGWGEMSARVRFVNPTLPALRSIQPPVEVVFEELVGAVAEVVGRGEEDIVLVWWFATSISTAVVLRIAKILVFAKFRIWVKVGHRNYLSVLGGGKFSSCA